MYIMLSAITLAITALLRELELTMEPAFQKMLKSPWREVELVSSESSYVAEISQHLVGVTNIAKERIEQRKYFRGFCDRIVGCVAPESRSRILAMA